MEAYHHRLANVAMRFTGKPVVLSPQVRDYGGPFPEIIQHMKGEKVDFRVVLFMGCIDMTEVAITAVNESECEESKDCLKIHVKHDFKDIYKLRYFKHGHIPCARECITYCRLPKGVRRGNLAAQWTQDSFLVIQSLKNNIPSIGFQCKRIVPIKVNCNLDPSLDLCSVISHATNVFQHVSDLRKKLNTIVPDMTSQELYGILSGDLVQPRDAYTDAGWRMQFETDKEADREATTSTVRGGEVDQEATTSTVRGGEVDQEATTSTVTSEEVDQEATTSTVTSEEVDQEATTSTVTSEEVDQEATTSTVSGEEVDQEANGSTVSGVEVDQEATIN